ncbi:hypothetical protein [Magnetococcus sp. PR-3]|uniref:hypothetical protein n=1 Tax=Magnetococcus sp. PR-3 TaxID=3120355 RepID=UPI002FCE0530
MESIKTIIHIDPSLDASAQSVCLNTIGNFKGVLEATFAETRPHLLRVAYDHDSTDASTVLTQVRDMGYPAQLVDL